MFMKDTLSFAQFDGEEAKLIYYYGDSLPGGKLRNFMKAYLKDQCGWFKKQERMDPFVQQYYSNKKD